jgi:DNA topoisomerase I
MTVALARRSSRRQSGAGKRTPKQPDDTGRLAVAIAENKQTAKAAGLRYVSDESPGIQRIKSGKGFSYITPSGKPIKDEQTMARIRSLAIPPAYRDVWICSDPNGHIQAVGRDARGRKQYRYHPRWREVRDENKYDKMIAFAAALPKIRARTARDIRKPGLPREKVLATVIQLMEKTLIRVGNDEYARTNDSYGLTTMRDKHAKVKSNGVHFQFKGKHGIAHEIKLGDPRLAKIVRDCQDLPGYELFQYVEEDGVVRDIGSADVNEYLREIAGEEFTAKDFRTWAGTVLAAKALREVKAFDTQAQAKRNVVAAIEKVAERLGNTKAVCRKCYIHPAVLNAYLDGNLVQTLKQRAADMARSANKLRPEEASVLALIQRKLGGSS